MTPLRRTELAVRGIAAGLTLCIITAWFFVPALMKSAHRGHPLDHYLRTVYRKLPVDPGLLLAAIDSLLLLAISAITFACTFARVRSAIGRILSMHSLASFFIVALVAALLLLLVASTTQLISYRTAALSLATSGFLASAFLILSFSFRASASVYVVFDHTHRVRNQSAWAQPSGKHLVLSLAALMLLVLLMRSHTFAEAYDRDLMIYMTIADRLLDGWPLYGVLWDNKPPAIFWTYMSFAVLFGITPLCIFVLGYTAFAITLFGCYYAGKQLSGKAGGLISGIAWSLVSGDLFLQGNQPNAEVFMNACLVWALGLTLRYDRRASVLPYVFIGLLFFFASLYKTVVVTIAILVLLAHLIYSNLNTHREAQSNFSLRAGLVQVVVSGFVAISGWILVFIGFFAFGQFEAFSFAVFEFNQGYAGNIFKNIVVSFLPTTQTPWFLPYAWLFLAVFAFSVIASLTHRDRKGGILLAYLIGAWLAIALPGRFFPHYYQLLLPPIAIAAGWLGAAVISANKRYLLPLYFSLLLLPLLARAFQAFMPINEIPVAKYPSHGGEALETKAMAEWINENYAQDATIYHWGAEPGVYFWSRRSTPVGFVHNFLFKTKSRMTQYYSQKVLDALEAREPDLIVANRNDMRKIDHPIEKWMMRDYKPIAGPGDLKHFVFLVPVDKNAGESNIEDPMQPTIGSGRESLQADREIELTRL